MSDTPIRFHYSLRSPYAWLAAEHALRADLPVKPIPSLAFAQGTVFADPAANPTRLAYIVEDVARLAARQGLKLAPPAPTPDAAWPAVHAAAEVAQRAGAGLAFIARAGRARWTERADLADPEVIAQLAGELGLDGAAAAAAMGDAALQAEMEAAYLPVIEADGVFGVPLFAFDGPDGRRHRYWGQDRMAMMLEDARALGVLA